MPRPLGQDLLHPQLLLLCLGLSQARAAAREISSVEAAKASAFFMTFSITFILLVEGMSLVLR